MPEYANNQRDVLARFFDDGRLVLTYYGAERAISSRWEEGMAART